MSENKSIALSELAAAIRAKQDAERRYEDIFLSRIDDIEFCLDHERYMAALALALTLPDICGKAEFPSKHTSVTERYIKWFNQFVEPYGKPISKYSDDMTYLSGEIAFNLRNSFLHSGNPNVTKHKIKEEQCKADKFVLLLEKSYTGDTSMVAYGKDMTVVWREYKANVYLLCTRLCRAARDYYLNNKDKFNFFQYEIEIGSYT